MATKKILVIIPTFNRKDLIEITSSYLRKINFDASTFSFLISDDCSTEYGLAFLETAYAELPNAKFMKTSRHSGAITHTWALLRLFMMSEFDKVLVFDSDLIIQRSCIQCISDLDDELVSSLYNSCFHEIDKECGTYCTKADIGWAGALIDKSIIQEMFDLFRSNPFDDWALCDLARRRNLTIKVSTPSAIEHLGVFGMNNAIPEYFDHSFDFPKESIDQATRDYFVEKHGFDLLYHLEIKPENIKWDRLTFFSPPPHLGN